MIQGRNFIFTGLQPWDIPIGSNAKDIALEVSRHNNVLYINTPLDKKTYNIKNKSPEFIQRKNVISGKSPELRQINPNLWILDYPFTIWPIGFLPDGQLFDWVNKLNNKRMYTFVKKILKQLHFDEYILFMDNDIYRSFYASEILQPIYSIYYRRDNLISAYWQKHAPRLEPLLCKKSDLVIANSTQLAEAVLPYNHKTFDIGQGVDLNQYDFKASYPLPQDISKIKRPIIGYVGWITNQRLDADLIYEVARQCPNLSFVMVGGEDDYFKTHKLHTLCNVFFTGEKPLSSIPSYVASFDICMNPQKINKITIGNYPRKIDEYLALGKPVIATKTETMNDIFSDWVYLASNESEYLFAINNATKDINNANKERERIQFAHTHSWENNVKKIYKVITSNLQQIYTS